MTPYLLAYLAIGALSFLALFILSASARQSVVEFIMEDDTVLDDALNVGLDTILHGLLVLLVIAGGVVVWPLVWAALGIGTWRLKKENKA